MSGIKFKNYIEETYIGEIITEIRNKYPLFSSLTMKRKDEILRKFHIIAVSCNTIQIMEYTKMESLTNKRKREEEETTSSIIPTKVQKTEEMENITSNLLMEAIETETISDETQIISNPPSPSYNPISPDYVPIDFENYEADREYFFENFEEREIAEAGIITKTVPEEESEYRFICPLLIGASNFNTKLELINCKIELPDDFPVEKIDIIDREKGKIIFISNVHRREYIEDLSSTYIMPKETLDKIGVLVCLWEKGQLFSEMCEGLNITAAKNFITKRLKSLMTHYPDLNITDVVNSTVISEYIKERKDMWESHILHASLEKPSEGVLDGDNDISDVYPEISIDDVIELLENVEITREDLPQAIWNGKILPYTCTKCIETEIDTDRKMIQSFFPRITDIHYNKCKTAKEGEEILNAIKTTKNITEKEGFSNFNTIKTAKTFSKIKSLNNIKSEEEAEIRNLLDVLGWEKKGKKKAEGIDDARQPEYKSHEKKSYPQWMQKVFLNESEISGLDTMKELNFRETNPYHPIDKNSIIACEKMQEIFSKRNISCTVSKYMNLCSRLSGAYLINISKSNKAHSSISVMPIYFLAEKNGEKKRFLNGFLIRGPHHVRDSTDKINVIIIEKISEDIEYTMLKKGIVAIDENKEKWFICKNAFTKIAPIYGAFLHDLLFLPTNFVGDMIFQSSGSMSEFESNCISIIDDNSDFLSHRIVEIAFMGLLGSSQEEGYLSGYRMLYMVLLELSRGNSCAVIDAKGFIDSLNECVINNSFVLFLHCSLRKTLEYINEIRNPNLLNYVTIGK